MMPSLVLNTQQIVQITKVLDELQSKTRASYAFLADISGQLIQVRGRISSTDMAALAALIAGNIAATSEIARRIGEPSKFRVLLHEGDSNNIYLSQVGDSFLLAAVFASDIQIGLVRLFGKRAADELTTLTSDYESAMHDAPSVVEAGFGALLDQELDRQLPV
jgi:predicted regulator of Ras-like GTPase activity (Roadblock/LC7/MglB family)